MDARDTGGFDRAGLVEVGGDAAGDAALCIVALPPLLLGVAGVVGVDDDAPHAPRGEAGGCCCCCSLLLPFLPLLPLLTKSRMEHARVGPSPSRENGVGDSSSLADCNKRVGAIGLVAAATAQRPRGASAVVGVVTGGRTLLDTACCGLRCCCCCCIIRNGGLTGDTELALPPQAGVRLGETGGVDAGAALAVALVFGAQRTNCIIGIALLLGAPH